MIRHLASRPEQRIGSLFFNPGGPGDSGVAAVAERGEALDTLTRGRFDIVGWDICGSAGSAPVLCFADAGERASFWEGLPVPTTRAEQRRYLAKTVALAQRCGARNGELLAHLATADTARDLDQLRRLVGDRRLSYLGESYGTLIGQTYANLFPHRVRAMALDGVVDPVAATTSTEAVLASASADTDRVFRKFLRLCEAAGPDRCALAGQGPVATRIHRFLAAGPQPDPGPIGRADLRRGPDRPQVFRPGRPGLVAPGRGPGLRRQPGPPPRHRLARCGASPGGRQQHRRTTAGLDQAPCASWPTAGADRYTGPWNATTKHPILVIGTRFDPNTPLANARRAARNRVPL